MPYALRVDNLSKRYRLGAARTGDRNLTESLRDAAGHAWRRLKGRSSHGGTNEFHALKDVSFEVKPGEVVGVVGANGAGKSTLLKLLSQVVEPTSGAFEYRGRLGSLLEVGTGFHPELTGRENIYLNGSLLGMNRREIDARFDEIVAFAELEKFLDTAVKRYSSGMYVRLAFAIAAHLQPEILILDEVLAVGDAQFQKKCLGKMRDAANDGRTVLFVSHDMAAIRRLCKRCLLLSKGQLVADDVTDVVVTRYLESEAQLLHPGLGVDLREHKRTGTNEAKFIDVRYHGDGGAESHARSNGPLHVELSIESDAERVVDGISVILFDQGGTKLVNADTIRLSREWTLKTGENRFRFRIERLALQPGVYVMGLWLARRPGKTYDFIEHACELEVLPPENDDRPRPVNDGVVWCDFDVTVPA